MGKIRQILLLLLCAFNTQMNRRCHLNTREHFREPLPIILRNGNYLEPTNSNGDINLDEGDNLLLSCEGTGFIQHPNTKLEKVTANITCVEADTFENEEWLHGPSTFSYFSCADYPQHIILKTNRTCYDLNSIYEVGYTVEGQFYPLYESCFSVTTFNNIYTKYSQKSYNAMFQQRVDRPYFISSNLFDATPVETLYSPKGLRGAVALSVGGVINTYFTSNQMLSRGHLAAKTDYVFAFGQRATFHYVNCAPQWTGFNGGNWNTLEVDLRLRVHSAGYDTIIYTGTYGVSQLTNEYGDRVNLYLYADPNNNPIIPVPMYYYKVVYSPDSKLGTAFVGLNNPYYNWQEARDLFLCEDVCEGNRDFSWLTWEPRNPAKGYSFCCSIPSFRNRVRHIPSFEVNGLLT